MIALISTLVSGLFSVGDKLIEDKDQKSKFAFQVLKMSNELSIKIMDTKTYPWIDAFIKLAYSADAIMTKLLRPVGSALLTGFVLYCDYNGIQLSDTVTALGAAAFPGWMASRHVNKQKAIGKKYVIDMDNDYDS